MDVLDKNKKNLDEVEQLNLIYKVPFDGEEAKKYADN